MKKVTLILILIFTTSIYSQYNLQFNRVVNEQLNANNQMVTVPDGKVWKIQAFYSNGNGNTMQPDAATFSITKPDGTYLSYRYFYANAMQNQTIWASAGDKISMAGSLPNSSNIMALNALEFNLSSVTSSGGSTGNSTNNNDGYSSNSSSSSSSNSYDGNNSNLSTPGDDFTDSEGNTYTTTVVDGLVWTTSNANHSNYRDGTPIPQITDKTEWDNATTGAWTYYAQDENNGWGKIYNAHAVRGKHDNDPNTPNKTFAPQGWRLPSQSNWLSLATMFMVPPSNGININSAIALKSTTGWLSVPGNNHSGLNMKPYGYLEYGNTEDSWNNGVGLLSTYFWAANSTQNNTYHITMGVYDSGSGVQLVTNYQSYPFNGAVNLPATGSNAYNSGNYVRLVKDAN
ncbi:fibrobacter succinogenes major paralogous domain-containing protein [bacterium]|nr:fibrobacter succinogenes major paralogous domain-containing protein [bacterium]